MYRRFFKKLIDRLVALFLLIVLSPLMAVVALAIYLNMGSPILFRQKRPGEGEEIFTIYKFRTMSMERDENGELLPDERRLGPLGRRLRSLSLDELPQLFNIVKGDMSFVGPRPLLDEYLPLYDERQRRRHEVTPGITGWAQVNGRNAISWKEKFEYDLWYVEHQSFSLDMKILWMTLVKILRREGIAHEGSATMEKFRGNG